MTTTLLYSKFIYDLTEQELRDCQRLTLGNAGRMLGKVTTIYSYRNQSDPPTQAHTEYAPSKGFFVKHRQEDALYGWSLAFPDPWQGGLISAFFYVDPLYRRQGVGTTLAHAVAKEFPGFLTSPWDHASTSFFQSLEEKSISQDINGDELAG